MPGSAEAGWFLSGTAAPAPGGRVFCFAHAGGNPRLFLDWQPLVGSSVEIVAVCPPGRAHRADESAPRSLSELADAAAEAIAVCADRPVYLFGHSFGALIAFEVARRLRGMGALHALVASGCSAPSLQPSARVARASRLEGREFAEIVASYGGLPPEIVADEELHHLLFPSLKADVRLIADYRYRPAAPLPVEVVLINGRDDPHVTADTLEPWGQECSAVPERHWAEGGHFYFTERPAAVVDVLRRLVDDPRHAFGVGHHVELI